MSDEELLQLADAHEAGDVPVEIMLDALEDAGFGRYHWLKYPHQHRSLWELCPIFVVEWPKGSSTTYFSTTVLLFIPEAVVRVYGKFWSLLSGGLGYEKDSVDQAKRCGLAGFVRLCVQERQVEVIL